VSRAAHQKLFAQCDIEPLRAVRWAAVLEEEHGKKG